MGTQYNKFHLFQGSRPFSQRTEGKGHEKVAPTGTKSQKAHTGTRVGDAEDPTVTETSTFSEITMTDDSDDDLMFGRKVWLLFDSFRLIYSFFYTSEVQMTCVNA